LAAAERSVDELAESSVGLGQAVMRKAAAAAIRSQIFRFIFPPQMQGSIYCGLPY
jgi:hypothetical protein